MTATATKTAAAGITKTAENGITVYTATIRKTETKLCILSRGGIIIQHLNAASRAWKGFGKSFSSFETAAANYKSAAMVAFVEACREDFQPTPSNVVPFETA